MAAVEPLSQLWPGDLSIFDAGAVAQALSEPGAEPLAVFRNALKQGNETIIGLFHTGTPAHVLVPARARFIDQLLVRIWAQYMDPKTTSLALIAVGGYGRGELHPFSDVDLMLLGSEDDIERHSSALEQFLTFLWDIGLEVGHSVRTLGDCVRESRQDVTVVTNLTEARLLSGPQSAFNKMRELTSSDCVWHNQDFFEAKKNEQKARYRKYHETAYNLEPNVKEGPGGLRDLQTLAWVAKRYFAADTLHDLVSHGFLTEREYDDLIECQNFLWQVRFALHALTGRREDRLLFDYQRQLAEQFGYHDHRENLAVEQFMQRYYRTIMEISRLNEMLLQLFEEAILLADEPGNPKAINRRFQIRHGFLEVTEATIFERYPYALLELFLILQQRSELKGVRAATVRLIRDHVHLIDAKFREDLRARSLFMEILRQPQRITRQLRRMNRYGILGAYLPEFALIVGRMQYDLFHVYTVDQHTLFVLRHLRRFYNPQFADEFPHCSQVMQRLPKPELVYIAALYHDIAKGRGGDHSELGALDAERFCQDHGLSEFDTQLVTWLVRHHLTMSVTAQKKDIDDLDVINDFAHFVDDQLHLDYLYVLTVADIRATNPKLWNAWRGSLLHDLYNATRRVLRRGLDNPVDKAQYVEGIQQQVLVELLRKRIDQQRIEAVWQGFSDDYFLRYSADEIVWHTRAILKKADDGRALVLARHNPAHSGTEIFIYTRDVAGVFAYTTAILDRLGLTVLAARIMTSRNGYALDSFTVLENSGTPIQDRQRTKEIVAALRKHLNKPAPNVFDSQRYVPRVLKHFQTPTEVTFDQDEANDRTLVEIVTSDRPGLLCRIGRAFMACDIQLQSAKIATIGARAEDVFFITNQDGGVLDSAEQQEALRKAIIEQLEQ